MTKIDSVKDLLMYHEGFRARVYDDETGHVVTVGSKLRGHPTIGYGRALDLRGISRDEANYLLENDLAAAYGAATSYPWFSQLNDVRQAVVVDMIYNLGTKGFGKFRRTIQCLASQDYERASVEMLDSQWAEQVGRRATHLASLMLTGAWGGGTAG